MPPSGGNIVPINIEDEMRRSYLDYSMSVIIGRALPDVRDGFKPVHRRMLYTMQEMGLQYNKKYTKCAKVVGQAMGIYHPHGDSRHLRHAGAPGAALLPALSMVDGQGNFGSVDGDPPAAMRYTECRLTRIAGEMLADIDQETVDFVPNYDESTRGADGAADAHSESHRQWIERHRGRHGDQHSAAQPHRDCERRHRAGEQPARRADRSAEARAGPGFPHRRIHLRQERHRAGLHEPAAAAS